MLLKKLSAFSEINRLRLMVAVFFVALALPAAALVWHAYKQLHWESFHQLRGMAEDVTETIDRQLAGMTLKAESRSFADYSFFVVAGDPSANFVQRSPLSVYPVAEDIAGVIGYFQVDRNGEFSTPILPAGETSAGTVGISSEELILRSELAQSLKSILSDNQLIENRQVISKLDNVSAVGDSLSYRASSSEQDDDVTVAGSRDLSGASRANESAASAPAQTSKDEKVANSQAPFDLLSELSSSKQRIERTDVAIEEEQQSDLDRVEKPSRKKTVASLNLDGDLQQLSVRKESLKNSENAKLADERVRSSRKEKIAVAEPSESRSEAATTTTTTQAGSYGLTIKTFDSEIDPYEFSLLDSGHFVLYRKVWRNNERYVQGILVDPERFIDEIIAQNFRSAQLAQWSDLVVAHNDDILSTVSGRRSRSYSLDSGEAQGSLLDRISLAAPFSQIDLIYTVRSMPPGPGATVLTGLTAVFAAVLIFGFYALYRTGLRQLSLRRQQQDFISAISHELKTPLTSIQMYAEMLKNDWADSAKKKTYYNTIFDESERLSRLIANVLQMASITRNDAPLNFQHISGSELMAQIETKILSLFNQSGFSLMVKCEDDAKGVSLSVDTDAFLQIAINLVDNAIKFSGGVDNKKIILTASLIDSSTFVFSVRDHGKGIPADQMNKIFEMFYRSESELTRETTGTGIGLAIVSRLAKLMSARVDVINRDPGAEFRVALPTIQH